MYLMDKPDFDYDIQTEIRIKSENNELDLYQCWSSVSDEDEWP